MTSIRKGIVKGLMIGVDYAGKKFFFFSSKGYASIIIK